MPTDIGEKRLLTVEQCANLLGLSRASLYPRLASGEIKSIKLGKLRRIAVEDLEAFVQRLRKGER